MKAIVTKPLWELLNLITIIFRGIKMKINKNYRELKDSYLFSIVGNKANKFQSEHPDVNVIKMGIPEEEKKK